MKKEEIKIEKQRKATWIIFSILVVIYLICLMIEMENLEEGYLLVVLNIVFMISCLLSWFYINFKYKKSLKVVQEYDYYRDLDFKKVNATMSGILLNTASININTIITAIYELSKNNIIKIELKNGKNYISLQERNKEIISKLLTYEKKIIFFIFENNEDTKEYCLENILADAKKDSTKSYILKDIEKEIKEYINTHCYLYMGNYIQEQLNPIIIKVCSMLCIIIFCLGLVPFGMSIFTAIDSFTNGFDIAVPIVAILIEYIVNLGLVIYFCKEKFLKEEYLEEVKKLEGLYMYMSDYTLLHDQELKFYQLYNTYYLYAMGLGVADKFENELGQEVLNNEVRTALQFYLQNREDIK